MPLVNEFGSIILIVKDSWKIFVQLLTPKCQALTCSSLKDPSQVVIQPEVLDVKVLDPEDNVEEVDPVPDRRLQLVRERMTIHR